MAMYMYMYTYVDVYVYVAYPSLPAPEQQPQGWAAATLGGIGPGGSQGKDKTEKIEEGAYPS